MTSDRLPGDTTGKGMDATDVIETDSVETDLVETDLVDADVAETRVTQARARRARLKARADRLRASAGRLRPRFGVKARRRRIPGPHEGQAEAERSWGRFALRAIPLSALLAVATLAVPAGALLPLLLGAGLGALLLGLLVLRRLEDLAQEADDLEQENARLLAEVEARDPALAERDALREGLRILLRREAERSGRQAVLGHELRNPLAGIVGVARLLAETDLTEEQSTYAQAVLRAASAMRGLTDDLLSGAGGGSAAPSVRAPVRLGALIGDVAELLAPGAHAKGLDLAAFVSPALPRELVLDERRLRQVLLNLAGNAVKYTDEGGVGIVAEETEDGRLRIAVLDSGVGIAPEERDRMFETFARAATTNAREGAGLGLALVARLVGEMDGTVVLDTGPDGRGTMVTVSLPLVLSPSGNPGDRPSVGKDLRGHRVHVDADRPVTSVLLARGLAVRGAELVGAKAGPDTVLHDLTGRDAAAFAGHMTSDAPARRVAILRPDQRRALPALREAGLDGYLIAPVRPRSLVAQVTNDSGASRTATTGTRRVLLVEDDAVNGLVATRLLETEGWTVRWSRDGAEALRIWEDAARGDAPFTVVVTDLDLPSLSGAELAIRLLRETMPPRVIILSADTEGAEAARLREAGVTDRLTKPLTRAALAEALAE